MKLEALVKPGQVDENSVIVVGVALDSEGSSFPAFADLDCKKHVAFVAAGLDCRQLAASAAADHDCRHLVALVVADLDCRQLVGSEAADLDYRQFAAFVAAGLPGMNIVGPAAAGVADKDLAGMASAADAHWGTEELVAAVTPAGLASAAADTAPVVLAEPKLDAELRAETAGPAVGAAAAAQAG